MWKDHEPAVDLVAGDFYNTNFFSEGSVDAVARRNVSKPFWLHLMHQAVHTGANRSPPSWEQWPGQPDYMSALSVLDKGIGNLTAALRSHGMWDNLIFVLSAVRANLFVSCVILRKAVWNWAEESCHAQDNGGDCGSLSGFASNFPLLGRK